MTKLFLESAQNLVNDSKIALNGGHYLESWALTVPARVAFAADAVISAVRLPFATLGVLFHSLESIAIWNSDSFKASLCELDLTINRLFSSTIGAVISTQWGSSLHSNKAKPFENLLCLIAAAAPNHVSISSRGKMTYGWRLH